jgi:hypothetical protein
MVSVTYTRIDFFGRNVEVDVRLTHAGAHD